jgi:hypothetical protein
MRFELAGSMNQPPPLAVKLLDGVPFVPQQYIDMGYTDFDVMAIGAGGGMGGGINTGNTGTLIRSFGGAGGGGGGFIASVVCWPLCLLLAPLLLAWEVIRGLITFRIRRRQLTVRTADIRRSTEQPVGHQAVVAESEPNPTL